MQDLLPNDIHSLQLGESLTVGGKGARRKDEPPLQITLREAAHVLIRAGAYPEHNIELCGGGGSPRRSLS